MREIRKDPIHNRWVIIASNRKNRPHAFYREEEEIGSKKECPFCEGKEKKTPPEIDSFRASGKPNEPGWKIRVVPNKFPALTSEGEPRKVYNGLYYKINGFGIHEVIIETPYHKKNLFNMDKKEISLIISMYKKRYLALKENKNLKYILIFKNHGKIAGGSLPHSHSQIIGLPLIPPEIEEEIILVEDSVKCHYCKLIQRAYNEERVLKRNKDFIVLAPYASVAPYELVIYPLQHKPCFEEINDSEINSLSELLQDVFKKYNKVLENPPFNYFLHTAPTALTPRVYKNYHWHIVIMPKLTMTAGFEKSSNIYINPVEPKEAVGKLREAGEEL
ncbi:DUF4931 domain-containing protein [candidate division WOR-3 bacterium]|nr:DUF4931 domain-containing protein [candidate division WOR-3 bacterium]